MSFSVIPQDHAQWPVWTQAMRKFFKFLSCLIAVVGCALAGGAVGSWWPVRDVPQGEIWAGDGIGMMMSGAVGLFLGAAVGVVGVALVLFLTRRRDGPPAPPRPRSAWARPDD